MSDSFRNFEKWFRNKFKDGYNSPMGRSGQFDEWPYISYGKKDEFYLEWKGTLT